MYYPGTHAEVSPYWEVLYLGDAGKTGFTLDEALEEQRLRMRAGAFIDVAVMAGPVIFWTAVVITIQCLLKLPNIFLLVSFPLWGLSMLYLGSYKSPIGKYRAKKVHAENDIACKIYEALKAKYAIEPAVRPFERDH